jgi:hypothetical protein
VKLVAEARIGRPEEEAPVPMGQHARVVLDLSGTRLTDRPAFLEERLLKTHGIVAAEINVFSNRMIVEFDPSIISVDKIKAMIKAADR